MVKCFYGTLNPAELRSETSLKQTNEHINAHVMLHNDVISNNNEQLTFRYFIFGLKRVVDRPKVRLCDIVRLLWSSFVVGVRII